MKFNHRATNDEMAFCRTFLGTLMIELQAKYAYYTLFEPIKKREDNFASSAKNQFIFIKTLSAIS